MADKYAVKEYVSNIIGNEYVIPVLGVWDTPEPKYTDLGNWDITIVVKQLEKEYEH